MQVVSTPSPCPPLPSPSSEALWFFIPEARVKAGVVAAAAVDKESVA